MKKLVNDLIVENDKLFGVILKEEKKYTIYKTRVRNNNVDIFRWGKYLYDLRDYKLESIGVFHSKEWAILEVKKLLVLKEFD